MSDSGSGVGASLSRLMAGRKRDSTVCKFFDCDASTDKSACMVQSEGTTKYHEHDCGNKQSVASIEP